MTYTDISRLALAAALPLAVASALVIGTPPAAADARTVTVNTGAGNINVRSAASTSAQLLRTIPNGSRIVITCYVPGETFRGGPYGKPTNIWNQLAEGGFVTDAMLETGSNNPVVPRCGIAPTPAATGRAMGSTRPNNAGASGYCTWGAYDKWFQASGRRFYPALSGDARNWANSARSAGWTVVDDAQPRSIVVFQPGVQGALAAGHVAWVDSTARRSDGLYVSITEMNGAAGLHGWSNRTVKDVPGMAYILLP